MAGQRPQPGLHCVDALRHTGEVTSLDHLLNQAQLLISNAGVIVPYRHSGGNERLPDRVGSEFLQRRVGIHRLVMASVSSRVEASLVMTSFRIAAIDLRL